MYIFSTVVAQLVFMFKSRFNNGIILQMIDNVPFCVELTHIVISEQGYQMDALSTLFFLFGLSLVLVGIVLFLIGWLDLGRVLYSFPIHVLIVCIGGIGETTCIVRITKEIFFRFFLLNGFNMSLLNFSPPPFMYR